MNTTVTFRCHICSRVCKNKGGLTSHIRSCAKKQTTVTSRIEEQKNLLEELPFMCPQEIDYDTISDEDDLEAMFAIEMGMNPEELSDDDDDISNEQISITLPST